MFPKQSNPDTVSTKNNISVRSPDEVEQLDRMIQTGPVTFVFVHADWCGHCQTYKPLWNELLNIPGRSANMGMIHHDMVERSPLLKNAKIPGYPTVLKVYPNGHIETYKGSDNEMTNAVPNMRDAESMKQMLLSTPVMNMTAKPNNITKMNRQEVVNTLLRKHNNKSLKNNLLKSLDNILTNNKKTLRDNKKKSNSGVSVYAVSQKTKRNIQNRTPSVSVTDRLIRPIPNEITIGASKVIPPLVGGSLLTALTQAVQQAGPTGLLLLANESVRVPPKKSRGSTMRLTRKHFFRKKGSDKSR